MGWSRKYLNNTSSPVVATITSTTEFTGYQGSVTIAAYDALMSNSDVTELDVLAGRRTIDKYVNAQKVYFPGPTGYKGSVGGYTGSQGDVGYRGSTA
jgi:hypothetical protein